MDEVYAARLSATPHDPAQHVPGDIHIQPHPFPVPHPSATPAPPNPIPIQLPNIFVNPYPAPPQPPTRAATPPPPSNVPTLKPAKKASTPSGKIKIGPLSITKPHPLLWISFGLSLLALVLGVPKGALPTLTGRHKALRVQEKLVNDKIHLLSHLAHFLPPPLSPLVHPHPADLADLPMWWTSGAGTGTPGTPALSRQIQFWNTYAGARHLDRGYLSGGAEGGERWWAVEELGDGASLVKSRGDGQEKEIWVLRMGETSDGDRPLLSALTHSLLLRDKLQRELRHALSRSQRVEQSTISTVVEYPQLALAHKEDETGDRQHQHHDRDEQDRAEERKRREREREKDVEEREREVARREKWVVDEMRKLSDKVHAQATELTLEDRITERLKTYQRQIAHARDDVHEPRSGESA